jgi:UDP-N-acetylglucosamine diphosphorylase/glucosamine-1-phosphate N-acetyltransferase
MANIILFDSDARNHLLPLTATRPMGELRVGILTVREKWERRLRGSVSYITQEYLQEKYPIHIEEENFIVNAGILPTDALCEQIKNLRVGEALIEGGELIAGRLNESQFESLIEDEELNELQGSDLPASVAVSRISHLWDLVYLNDRELRSDFELLCAGRRSQAIPDSVHVIGDRGLLFLEEGAKVECSTLNVSTGPIYIGQGAEVMEGCMLRGPISIGAGAILKMGAKVYGPTTIGPGCRAGGEVARSIMLANSNKGHDGFLGDSVLGEWCNIGADSNNSNLKNNYAEVKLWDYASQKFEKTGHQFVGLFMGDHAKCGINTMFNTGTVVGVSANVYGAGYQRNFIPDFAWGGADSAYRTYKFAEAVETAEIVQKRRNIAFTELEKAILYHVYDQTAQYRTWDK